MKLMLGIMLFPFFPLVILIDQMFGPGNPSIQKSIIDTLETWMEIYLDHKRRD